MLLRSGKTYAVKTPGGSATASKTNKRVCPSESGMLNTILLMCKRLLRSTYIWLRDLLYYTLLCGFLCTLLAIIASSVIIRGHQPSQSYYDTLGVSPLAAKSDIKAAYRKLSLQTHPDKLGSSTFDNPAYLHIREAYETLSAEDHVRCTYDLTNGIESLWSSDDCIRARREFNAREELRRLDELEKARQKNENEKKERQRRREERWRQQEERDQGAMLVSRSAAALKGFFANIHAPW